MSGLKERFAIKLKQSFVMKSMDIPEYYNAINILENNLNKIPNKAAITSVILSTNKEGSSKIVTKSKTFKDISSEVNKVGNALKKMDIRSGDMVGLLMKDSIPWVASFFGCIKGGAVAVCMNTLLKPADYNYILRDSRLKVLIIHDLFLKSIIEILKYQPFLQYIIIVGNIDVDLNIGSYINYNSWIKNESIFLKNTLTHRDDFCTLNYTSGTTGKPKGVLHSHKDYLVSARLWEKHLKFKTKDRTFSSSKLFFTYGLNSNLISPWHVGADTILFDGSPKQVQFILKIISELKPTIFYSVPSGYALMLEADELMIPNLSSLRLCFSSGEHLPASLGERWTKTTGLNIINVLGATETLVPFLSNKIGKVRHGVIGKPIQGCEAKVVDKNGNSVRCQEKGRLLIKCEATSLSYMHDSDKSREVFLGEWLCTGDQCYIDNEGFYHFCGRADDMLKIGGIWVSPIEVENVLFSHHAISECVVIGKKNKDNLIKPKAFVVLKNGHKKSSQLEKDIIEHCKKKSAFYKRPREIEFIDKLPKTATGKIQRFKLAAK